MDKLKLRDIFLLALTAMNLALTIINITILVARHG